MAYTLELLHIADQEAITGAIVDAPNLSVVLEGLRTEELGNDGVADNTVTLSSGDAFIPGVFSARRKPRLDLPALPISRSKTSWAYRRLPLATTGSTLAQNSWLV